MEKKDLSTALDSKFIFKDLENDKPLTPEKKFVDIYGNSLLEPILITNEKKFPSIPVSPKTEDKPIDIGTIKSILGQPDYSPAEGIASLTASRQRAGDEHIRHLVITGAYPVEPALQEITTNQVQAKEFLTHLTTKNKIARQSAIIGLTLKGVKNASQVVAQLEASGSYMLFTYDVTKEVVERVHYDTLTSSAVATAIKSVDNFPTAISRFSQLGYTLYNYQLTSSPFLPQALSDIAKMPQSRFDTFKEHFLKYSCIDSKDSRDFFEKNQENGSDNFSHLGPNFQSIINSINAGGFTPVELERLDQAQRLSGLLGFPKFSLDKIINDPDVITDSLVVTQEVLRLKHIDYNHFSEKNTQESLEVLEKSDILHGLAEQLADGLALDKHSVSYIINFGLQAFANDDGGLLYIQDKVEKNRQIIQPDTFILANLLVQIAHERLDLNTSSQVIQLVDLLHDIALPYSQLPPQMKVDFIQLINQGYFQTTDISKFPHSDKLGKFNQPESRHSFTKFEREVLTQVVLHKDGQLDFDMLLKYYQKFGVSIVGDVEINDILDQCPDSKKPIFEAIFHTDPIFHNLILHNTSDLDLLFKDGQITPFLLELVATKTDCWSLEQALLNNPSILENFDPKSKKFWKLWLDADRDTQRELAKLAPQVDNLFTAEGAITSLFLEAAIELLSKDSTNDIYKINQFITPDSLASFSPDDKVFWERYRLSQPGMKGFLLENKSKFAQYFNENGVPTQAFIKGIVSSISSADTFLYRRPVEIYPYITDEYIATLEGPEKDFWTIVQKSNPDSLYRLSLLIDNPDRYEQLHGLAPYALKVIDTYQDLVTKGSFPNVFYEMYFSLSPGFVPVAEVLLDPKICELFNKLPPEFGFQLVKTIIGTPSHAKTMAMEYFTQSWVRELATCYPGNLDKLAELCFNQPRSAKAFTAFVTRPELKNLFVKNPKFFTSAIEAVDLMPQDYLESVGQLDIEILMGYLIDRVIANEPSSSIIESLESCSQVVGKTTQELIIQNLTIIYKAFRGDTQALGNLFKSIDITPYNVRVLAGTIQTQSEALKFYTSVIPLTTLSQEDYLGMLSSIPSSILPKKDVSLIKKAVLKHGDYHQFFTNRSELVELMNFTSPETSTYIANNLLYLNYSPDPDDYVRGPKTERSNSLPRRESRLPIDMFKKELEQLPLSQDDISQIMAFRIALEDLLLGRPVTYESSDPDKVTKINSQIAEFFGELRELHTLDSSADSFALFHEGFNKSRQIPEFNQLWIDKIRNYFEDAIIARKGQEGLSVWSDSLKLYLEGFALYRRIHQNVIPEITEMNDLLDKKIFKQGIWFSGRDGIPLYLAMKSKYFGKVLGNREVYVDAIRPQLDQDQKRQGMLLQLGLSAMGEKELSTPEEKDNYISKGLETYLATQARLYDLLKFVSISRLVFSNATTPDDKDNVRRLLVKNGINPKMVGVDTGNSGSVMRSALNLLGGEIENNLVIWGPGKIIDKPYSMIEGLPKTTDRTIIITKDGNPVRMPTSPDLQLLHWVSNHAIIRHLAPRSPETQSTEIQYQAIENFIDKITDLDQEQKSELVENTKELYNKTKEVVAPVIIQFADHLLTELSTKGENSKIIFVARDGIGPYQAALGLLAKYPTRYPNVTAKQLAYGYFSRKVVASSNPAQLSAYVSQLGIEPVDDVTLADIGMYGTIIGPLRSKLKDYHLNQVEYLISRTPNAQGFLENGIDKKLSIFERIMGSPVIHFLEDTFSGLITSPSGLVETETGIQPDTYEIGYSPNVAVKREFALRAITDFVKEADISKLDYQTTVNKFVDFFKDPKNFTHLLIPHE